MVEDVKVRRADLPAVPAPKEGYERSWYKCPECGAFQYYDYIPYSLSNPILTAACGHNQFGRKIHEYMHSVIIIEDTPVGRFRDDADYNYLDHLEHSGEIIATVVDRTKAAEKFPTVLDCLTKHHVVSGYEDSKIEEITGIALTRGILCAAENAVADELEKAGLHKVEELASTQYEDEEIDHEGTIKGVVIMEYVGGQRYVVKVELPMDDYADDEKLASFIKHLLPGEKEFEIEQYEIHATTYRVKAINRAQAIAHVINGSSAATATGTKYVQVLHEQGMPQEGFESHEIREIEQKIKARLLPGLIDSIKSVRKV